MKYLKKFTIFKPSKINVVIDNRGLFNLKKYNLIVCGEMHGIKENSDVVYFLYKYFNCKVLALEWTEEEVQPFLDSAIAGNPDISLIDERIFTGSLLSIEMLKTITLLLTEGLIEKIIYIDKNIKGDREQILAEGLNKIPRSKTVLCLMGNWHTTTEVIKIDDKLHESALYRYRKYSDNALYIEYKYKKGYFYNIGTGLDEIEVNDSLNDRYELIKYSPNNFSLTIPEATPITH